MINIVQLNKNVRFHRQKAVIKFIHKWKYFLVNIQPVSDVFKMYHHGPSAGVILPSRHEKVNCFVRIEHLSRPLSSGDGR